MAHDGSGHEHSSIDLTLMSRAGGTDATLRSCDGAAAMTATLPGSPHHMGTPIRPLPGKPLYPSSPIMPNTMSLRAKVDSWCWPATPDPDLAKKDFPARTLKEDLESFTLVKGNTTDEHGACRSSGGTRYSSWNFEFGA